MRGAWKRLLLLAAVLALSLAQETPPASPPAAPEEEPELEATEAVVDDSIEEDAEEPGELDEPEPPPPTPTPPPTPPPPTLPKPSPSPATSTRGSASVQFMVTAEMKAKLLELGYTEADIESLQPERARVIVERGLKRTSTNPASWTRQAKRDGPVVPAWRRLKTPTGAAGLAVSALATLAVASLSSRPQPNFALAPRGKIGKAASVQPVKVRAAKARAAAVAPLPPPPPSTDSDLWLDRQIDKLVAFLAGMFRR